MAVEFTHRSRTLHESLWLCCAGDPLVRIVRRVAELSSIPWSYALPGGPNVPEGDVAFALDGVTVAMKPERSLRFSWRHACGAPLPSLTGTITASRFGPFANITVNAAYVYGSDPASTLAHESVGRRYAAMSLRCLLQLLRAMFPAPVRRAR
jgi:hypothetical protein